MSRLFHYEAVLMVPLNNSNFIHPTLIQQSCHLCILSHFLTQPIRLQAVDEPGDAC
ncbi:hypothetical protein BBBOND_0301170 [Babesia bigemina]|uniref:Uncharacterized protein n=1 Tax=Babesia bigemina TaxID=5866 RepID=A0A061D8A5_BABBI|nr:hypothetical protein BBBOND_0301170 [Babesia bigemina]CDR96212.1 hypothetical protein BBBOND_0301170 [Babesia bigemina]|eukprot:XP_012768398.1 hypothetical protein BBBOND_0301170 [Babesia bigemina]